METVQVSLGNRSYPILIEGGLLDRTADLIKDLPFSNNATIVTNTTIAPLYLERLRRSLVAGGYRVNEIILPDGEHTKEIAQAESIFNRLLSFGLDRRSPLVALGGGVVGDITGFAASAFLRGVPFLQIPTTLLAQVDSSVGGKTGVNLPGAKNMVGAFYQPSAVIIDPEVLTTLDARELKAGMAEVIKYGIIRDRCFFEYLEDHLTQALELNQAAIARIIKTCCRIKAEVTSQDETEKGLRAILNFGHTIGHAVETLTRYDQYKHGEAVAIGSAAAARLSCTRGFCGEDEVLQVERLFQCAGLPVILPDFSAREYLEVMSRDKKRSGSDLRMVLMKKIGEVVTEAVTPERLEADLESLLIRKQAPSFHPA